MMLVIEPRAAPSPAMLWLTPLLAVALTVLAGALLFQAMGYDPARSLHAFFISPLTSRFGLAELGVKAAPLVLIATGLAIGFRAGVWNIGAEGQFTLGAIAAGGVALLAWGQEGWWTLPAMALAGVLGGMAWAAVPAFLRARLGVNEILVSLMLTYVALLLLSYLVYGPWKSPAGFNFPETRMFGVALPILWPGTRLHLGVAVAVLAALAAWFVMSRTLLGFEIKVVGIAPRAARYAGFSTGRLVWASFMVSGGLAGLAGCLEVAGPIGQLVPVISPGYGFTAIIVAFLGRLHPLGVVPAGLVVALSYIGGENAQISVGLPQAVTGVFQGMLLFFLLAVDLLARYRLRLRRIRPA
jgi:simple sugar transport system permease protein